MGYIPSQDLPPRPANSALPATNPLGSGYNLQPFYLFGISYAQPNFNNPTGGLHGPAALHPAGAADGVRPARHHQGDLPRVRRPDLGPAPNPPPGNQWIPAIQKQNSNQGPYPFNIAKAKSLLTSHGWAMQAA